jgi:3-oxoacyl-[acyl-carrier-protein] synthase-3
MKSLALSVKIAGTGSCVPDKILSNREVCEGVSTTPEWVESNLGIFERRVAEDSEQTSDFAARAGLRAVTAAGISVDEVDLIIVATATPDRKSPSTACIVQEKMGIRSKAAAFDVSAVCSGFLYALCTASQFIISGVFRNVLVIGADTFSKITNWERRDCVFFGDGAGAVLLQPTSYSAGLFDFKLFADGTGKDNFTVYPGDEYFTMNGRAVYETGTKVLPEAIMTLLEKQGLVASDIACVIPHQPSIRVLQRTAEVLGMPFDKIKRNMDRYANTAGATVPLLLDEVVRAGQIQEGDLVLFAAVGSGWTWGAAIYRWH